MVRHNLLMLIMNRICLTTLGDINTLYIGDNRSSYFVGASTPNSANGQFDDFRIYNSVQNGTEVVADIE